MLPNIKDKILQDFPFRRQFETKIITTGQYISSGARAMCDIVWHLPVDHKGECLPLTNLLRRVRKSVGASIQPDIMSPNKFLHIVRDSENLCRQTLYSRFIRSLFANCIKKIEKSPDYVGLILDDKGCDVMWLAYSPVRDQMRVTIHAYITPHEEPDWKLDDFCRREALSYQQMLAEALQVKQRLSEQDAFDAATQVITETDKDLYLKKYAAQYDQSQYCDCNARHVRSLLDDCSLTSEQAKYWALKFGMPYEDTQDCDRVLAYIKNHTQEVEKRY